MEAMRSRQAGVMQRFSDRQAAPAAKKGSTAVMAGFLTFTKEKPINRVVEVDISDIRPNPHQPRSEFDIADIQSLADSILQNGILQPLTVRRGENRYELIAGERRLRAAKLAGLRAVPCIILDISSRNSAIMALVENIQRQDLSFFDEASAIEKLITYYGMTQEDAAAKLGKAQSTIANKLHEDGLVRYKWFFKLFGRVRHAESRIGIGTYAVNSDMDYDALINRMSNKNASLTANTVKISIPEGYNVRQIIALMDKYGVNTAEKLTDAALNADFNYSFIDNNKKGDLTRLEGYLFPDTYEFFVDEDPAHALSRLLDNFNTKMSDEIMQKVESSGYSLNQILTIASLIEKETDGTDRENIASVIYNRLNNVGETYHKLQIDASLIYGLGENYTGTLTSSDLNYNTPYNLSMYEGLPPTPIANPGLASIQAALDPAQTNYYFYALGKDGVHHFFKTYAEHSSFVSSSQYAG